MITNNPNLTYLKFDEKDFILVGTAHVSKESIRLAKSVIEQEKPDTVCVELCSSRFQAIQQKDRWQNTDIVKIVKEKKSFLLLSNLLLASFQKRIAKQFDVKPGEEMITAIESAESVGAQIHLADRDIRTTLSRTWRVMGFWSKLKLIFQLMLSLGQLDEIKEEDIEQMKQQDVLETLLTEVGKSLPEIKSILIDERDQYLAEKIRTAPGNKIVAVVGAGHIPGIQKHWQNDINIHALETLPPKSKTVDILKWLIPAAIIGLFLAGFFYGGKKAGTDMILWWILANGILAGIGAIMALAHPATIVSSILAAPLTSLNPMIAAGWVSGLVEAFSRKPKVRDLETLPDDILSVRGFWKNNVTRILLVVVFTNLGSSLGTFIAFPFIVKVLIGASP
ncbi:MAG: TraB/GumN family protein [Desulfobacterales bacterium]|jgi:pheromone shutdown-related protein TraB